MLNWQALSTIRLAKHYVFLAQTEGAAEEAAEQTRYILYNITIWQLLQAIVVIIVGCTSFILVRKIINVIAENGGRRGRLKIKRMLPFWRLIALIAVIIILANIVFNFSLSYALNLVSAFVLVIGFAVKDYIGSLIAGVIGLFEYCYHVGDRVTIGEYYGEVVEYGLRTVRLRTPGDSMVIIPHSKLWTEAISNANYGNLEMQVVTKFYFGHSADFELVTHFLYQAAYTSKYTQLKLPILVVSEEKPWGICFEIRSYPMDARDEMIYKTDLAKRANRAFSKFDLPRPIVDVDLLD